MTETNDSGRKQEMVMISEVLLQTDQEDQRVVILKERKDADMFFMMFVGDTEFMAIAKEKGAFTSPRPMTHEIYLKIIENTPIVFTKIEIHSMTEGTYYANIYFKMDGKEVALDARPSDSVALALHGKVPIFVNKELMRRMITEKDLENYRDLIKTVKF
jgi:uncharacterized protein